MRVRDKDQAGAKSDGRPGIIAELTRPPSTDPNVVRIDAAMARIIGRAMEQARIQRLPPLAQRLRVDFATEARFDNPRAVQIRLPAFTRERLQDVGRKVRDIFVDHAAAADRIRALVSDEYVADLADAVTGKLGGRVGIVPRLFLKKLVADVLDRVDQFPEFDPRQHYSLTIAEPEMTTVERAASGAATVDDIDLGP